MSPLCQRTQDALLDGLDSRVAPEAHAHLQGCAYCAQFAVRHARLRRAFDELSRHAAPEELAGRVVASCHAGHRQQRAIELVESLSRWNVPHELDRKVWEATSTDGSSAPDVLERLVEEDLRDPSKALARRFAGRLTRLSAPEGLLARVEAAFAADPRRARSRFLRFAPAVVALAVTTVALVVLWSKREIEPTYSFEVRRASIGSLDPEAQVVLNALSGGLLSATEGPR